MFAITGGGSGIGRALACALASRGHDVLIAGRSEGSLRETAGFSSRITTVTADLALPSGRDTFLAALQDVPRLQALVHNAGTVEPIAPLGRIPESMWQQAMATNLHAPLFLTQALLGKLKQGRVLHIGSGAAHFPVQGWAAYCVSKAGLAMLTRCWQLEWDGGHVASVMPGIIDTDMQALIRQAGHMDPAKLAFFRKMKQEGTLLQPETVALFLAWLLLDTPSGEFTSMEWDIYDTSHHARWLVPPHTVPGLPS